MPGLLACATLPSFYSLFKMCGAHFYCSLAFQVSFSSGKLDSQAKPGGSGGCGDDRTVPQDGSLSWQKEEQQEGSSKVQKGDFEKPGKEALSLKM